MGPAKVEDGTPMNTEMEWRSNVPDIGNICGKTSGSS
jgi:hypothetical protein